MDTPHSSKEVIKCSAKNIFGQHSGDLECVWGEKWAMLSYLLAVLTERASPVAKRGRRS